MAFRRVQGAQGGAHLASRDDDNPPGIRLRLYPTSVSEMYWMKPDARSADHAFLDAFLQPGMTVVDVGANIGALTVHAAKAVGGAGPVIAIEAHPRTYQYLLGNTQLNGCTNVQSRNLAVGDSPGSVLFSDFKADDINHVVQPDDESNDHDPRHGRRGSVGMHVPVETLDSIVAGAPVSLLKVDVEGYEQFVLAGAHDTLRSSECVNIESFEQEFSRYGYHTGDMVRMLDDAGLVVFRQDGARWVRVTPDHVSSKVENLIALRDPALISRVQTRMP